MAPKIQTQKTKMTHSSKRRKQHRASDLQGGIASLWSVNEGALGMGVQGLKMEPGKRREERKKVLQGEPGTKDISAGDSNMHVVH